MLKGVFDGCAVDLSGEKTRDKCIARTHRINNLSRHDALPDDPRASAKNGAALALRNADHRGAHGVNTRDERFRLSIREV